jgi:hypothetical protein
MQNVQQLWLLVHLMELIVSPEAHVLKPILRLPVLHNLMELNANGLVPMGVLQLNVPSSHVTQHLAILLLNQFVNNIYPDVQ